MPATPLNTNGVTPGASRLGLTPREIPAAIEVVGADTIREQGYHTTIDSVKGASPAVTPVAIWSTVNGSSSITIKTWSAAIRISRGTPTSWEWKTVW